MAGVTWTRTRIVIPPPSSQAVELMTLRLMDALGREGVGHIQERIWAVRRFKRPTGRSTNAWTYRLARKAGSQEIRFINPATDRGVNYPRYVHLAGRPRSDLLMFEVREWGAGEFLTKMHARFVAGYEALKASQPKKTTREVL